MNLFTNLYDKFTGPCLRKIHLEDTNRLTLFLTFDDGPDPYCTPLVLKLLNKYKVKATFFVIGKKVQENKGLFKEIIAEQHTIGNHTYDHRTRNYFASYETLYQWIRLSHDILQDLLGNEKLVGFRSPVGIKTPDLNRIMRLNEYGPLILWNIRFFDTLTPLKINFEQIRKSLTSGSIILLHDRQKIQRVATFLFELEFLIQECIHLKINFCSLTRTLVEKTMKES